MPGCSGRQRMADLGPDDVAEWCGTLRGVLPPGTRDHLHVRILEEGLDGNSFSMMLNKHILCDLNVKGLTLAMAQKVRRCWHQDFPDSDQVTTPIHQREHASFEVTSMPAGHEMESAVPSSASRAACANQHTVGREAHEPAVTPKRTSQRQERRPSEVELLRAALDCVAERANLDRQEVYLWVHNVIPNEVWQPLWANVTADMLRHQSVQSQRRPPPHPSDESCPVGSPWDHMNPDSTSQTNESLQARIARSANAAALQASLAGAAHAAARQMLSAFF